MSHSAVPQPSLARQSDTQFGLYDREANRFHATVRLRFGHHSLAVTTFTAHTSDKHHSSDI